MWAYRVEVNSISIALSQRPAYTARPQIWVLCITSHGVPVYAPAFAGTKLYCLVTKEHGCEQLAQGCYSTAQWLGLELINAEYTSH